jgi:hypothetical protein
MAEENVTRTIEVWLHYRITEGLQRRLALQGEKISRGVEVKVVLPLWEALEKRMVTINETGEIIETGPHAGWCDARRIQRVEFEFSHDTSESLNSRQDHTEYDFVFSSVDALDEHRRNYSASQDSRRELEPLIEVRKKANQDRREDEERRRKAAALQREAEQEAKTLKAAQALEEAEKWCVEHGSSRLKKGVALGLMEDLWGAYREERLEKERPGWSFRPSGMKESDGIYAPPEEALDAVIEDKQLYGDLYPTFLAKVRFSHVDSYSEDEPWKWALTSKFMGRDVYRLI